VLSGYYPADQIPGEDQSARDLRRFLGLYSDLVQARDQVDATDSPCTVEMPAHRQQARRYRSHLRAEGRNTRAAKDAKRIHGDTCQVSGFDFAVRCGEIGGEFMEGHHWVPFAQPDEHPKRLDPATDFAVVCAHCHRMLHRQTPPFMLED